MAKAAAITATTQGIVMPRIWPVDKLLPLILVELVELSVILEVEKSVILSDGIKDQGYI